MSLEDRFRQTLDDAVAEVRRRLEAEFTSTLTDVRVEADRDKIAALAAAEQASIAALAAAEAAAEEAKAAALAEARTSLEAELMSAFQAEKGTLASSHEMLLAQAREAAEGEVVRVRDEADTALTAAKAELQQTAAELAREREALEAALTQAKHDAAADVEKARTESAAEVEKRRTESAAELEKARVEAESGLAALRVEHDAALTAARTEAQAVAAAHSQALDAQLTGAIRLLESVRALDGATSLTEVLDALTLSAAKEAGRAAILVVKGDRLMGWRTSGFGSVDEEPRSIESSTADVGALAAAVNTSRPAVVGSGSVLAAPAFSQLPPDRPGLAVPLLVAGRPVAVLYADAGASAPASPGWTSPVEVLVRHAGRCLEAMAVSRGAHVKASAARVGMPA
jgi:hypothetical protein